jgi:hypothetical protein
MGNSSSTPPKSTYTEKEKELVEASWNGELEKVKELLSYKDINIDVAIQHGKTPLHLAVITPLW